MQVILWSVGQVDRRRNVDRLGIGVVGQEVEMMRKRLTQADRARVIQRKPDGLDVQRKPEARIQRSKLLFAAAGHEGITPRKRIAIDAGIHRQPHSVHPLVANR